jgi:hypothetical protein
MQVLEAALSLPGVKGKLSAEQRGRLAARGALPSTTERASLYLLLVEVLRRSGTAADQAEARKVGVGGWAGYQGQEGEVHVWVAGAVLCLQAGCVGVVMVVGEGPGARLQRVLYVCPGWVQGRRCLPPGLCGVGVHTTLLHVPTHLGMSIHPATFYIPLPQHPPHPHPLTGLPAPCPSNPHPPLSVPRS